MENSTRKKRFRLKSVQGKFLIWLIPAISVILIALAILLYYQESSKQLEIIEDMSLQVVSARGDEVEKWLSSLVFEMQQIAKRNIVQTMDWQVMQNEIKTIADNRKDTYGFLALVRKDGYYYSTLKNLSDKSLASKDYFKKVFEQQQNFAISNPYYSLTTGEPIFVVIVPVHDDNGELIGGFAGIVYLSTLSKIVRSIKIGNDGYGFTIDNDGRVFAHPKEDFVLQLNVLESAEKGFQNLDKVGQKMLNSQSGIGSIVRPDESEAFIIYNKIPKSPNWTLGVAIPKEQVFAASRQLLIDISVFFLITIAIVILIIWLLSRNIISRPLKNLIEFTQKISKGHLYATITTASSDEVGQMAKSLHKMSEELMEIATRIRSSAANIATGSTQVSSSASQIAEGAGEQASSTEQVSSSIEEMVSIINQNADNAKHTENTAMQAANDIEEVKNTVEVTIKAINKIAQRVTIISEIAEKTDLLAINAAVEAARAGENGKGFAIVASEVRKLAEQSQKAAEEISEVSFSSVDIAEKAGKLLEKVVPVIKNNANLVREISAASAEQNAGADQINNAVQQLAQVTQENSAASEQMASSSEELASQAELLRETVAFFKTNEDEARNTTTDMAYKKLLETLEILKTDKNALKGKKIELDFTEEEEKKKENNVKTTDSGKKQPDEGATIRLDDEDDLDKNFKDF